MATESTSNQNQEICELALCESVHLILRPNQLYIFRVCPDCEECKKLEQES